MADQQGSFPRKALPGEPSESVLSESILMQFEKAFVQEL